MKGLDNPAYLYALIVSNIVAVFFLVSSLKWPRLARLLFFLLFSWACYVNSRFSQLTPSVYLEYGELAITDAYKDFINGWFSRHIGLLVGFIALCQGFMAVAFLLKGMIYKSGCIAAMIFLIAILPLGTGSGFPAPLIGAVAVFILYRKGDDYIWRVKKAAADNSGVA